MNKKLVLPLAALLLALPMINIVPAYAGHDMSGMNMGNDKTIMLENTKQDGVMAMAHLYDVREAMAKHGMKETHHMMVMFTDEKSGKPLVDGVVAVKVIDPSGAKGEAIKMKIMGEGFGADISLAAPGKYTLEVGSKLADAKKRVFTFTYGK